MATRLCSIEFDYYAAPAYLTQYDEPQTPEDLAQHQCLHYSLISRAQEWNLQDKLINTRGQLSVNNGEVLCAALVEISCIRPALSNKLSPEPAGSSRYYY